MLERKHLQIDPLFSDKYFSLPEAHEDYKAVDFELPDNPANLEFFFALDAGKTYKQKMRESVNRLHAWATDNGLRTKLIYNFTRNYIQYSGTNPDTNMLYWGLYSEGVPLLNGIVELLESEKIEKRHSQLVIKVLLEKMDMCAPGVHTYLFDAYSALLAYVNIDINWMDHRRSMAQQLVLEIVKAFGLTEDWEVHYANAVINRYADMLGIPLIEDEYISKCRYSILNSLLATFEEAVVEACMVENLVAHHAAEIGEHDFIDMLNENPGNYGSICDDFTSRFDVYGIENENGRRLLSVDDVVRYSDEGMYSLTWKASYIIKSSIFNRLAQSGVPIDLEYLAKISENRWVDKANCVYYLADGSLDFAYVHRPGDKNKKFYQPFIPWCVEKLARSKTTDNHLGSFIMSDCLTSSQRHEIIEAISIYINSDELKQLDSAKIKIQHLEHILRAFAQVDACHVSMVMRVAVVRNLPDLYRHMYALLDEDEKVDILFAAVTYRSHDVLACLIKDKVDVNAAGIDGVTALMIAAKYNHVGCCKLLMKNGALPSTTSELGQNAFHVAAANGSVDVLRILLQGDIRFARIQDIDGKTALSCAVAIGHEEIVKALLDAGVNFISADIARCNAERDPGVGRVMDQVLLARDVKCSKAIKHIILPATILSARLKACERLRYAAIHTDADEYDVSLNHFKDIDAFLQIYSDCQPHNPDRINGMARIEKLLVKTYNGFQGNEGDHILMEILKENMACLSAVVNHDHRLHGKLGKYGFFSKSRLAKNIDQALGKEFFMRRSIIR